METRRLASFVSAFWFAAFAGAACGGGTGGAPDAPSGDDDDDGGGGGGIGFVAARAGFVLLSEGEAYFGTFGASLRDGPDVPAPERLASEGECEVWRHPPPGDCSPPCDGEACDADGICVPFPAAVDAGAIAVTGLTIALGFEPGEFGYVAEPELPPEELFADDAAIVATAAGGDAPGFTLEASGVPPLVADLDLEFDVTLVIEDGVDRTLRWTAAGVGAIQLALVVGHHGAPYAGLLVCETEDDGELTIPGGIIAALPRDASGFEQHGSWLARFSRDTVETAGGPVELFVSSRVAIPQLDHR